MLRLDKRYSEAYQNWRKDDPHDFGGVYDFSSSDLFGIYTDRES